MKKTFLLVIGLLLLAIADTFAADPLATWRQISPLPTCNPIRDIAHGNGLWVGVGDAGTIITSDDDGQTWALQSSGVTNLSLHFSGVMFSNNLFVAVGSLGLAATSSDGTNWTLQTIGAGNRNWSAIAFGNNRWVAVAGGTTTNVAVSANGTSWTQLTATNALTLNDVTYAQGLFVGVGTVSGGFGSVLTSPDGTNWTARLTNGFTTLSGVTYGGGRFVGVGNTLTVISTDGVSWTIVTNTFAAARLGVAYGNGAFVSVGATAPFFVGAVGYTSADGTNWTFVSTPAPLEVVRFANGRFAAVGSPTPAAINLYGTVQFSTNGTSWSSPGFGGAFATGNSRRRGLVFGNGQFAMIQNDSAVALTTNFIQYSQPYQQSGVRALAFGDGKFVVARTDSGFSYFAASDNNWSPSGAIEGVLNALCFGNSLWVGVGQDGKVATSPNGSSWTDVPGGVDTNHLLAVTHGNGVFVAVGAGGAVARSTDGNTWSVQSLGTTNELRAVTWADGLFVAVGYAGKIFTSPNGTTWTARSSGTLLSLNAVAHCLGRFVATGDGGLTLSSSDGTTWTHAAAVLDDNLLGVAAAPAQAAVAVGDNQAVQFSSDALAWRARLGDGAWNMWRVIYHNSRFVAAMDGGVAYSATGRSWRQQLLMGTLYSVIGLGNQFVAVGSGDSAGQPAVFVSNDAGENWLRVIPGAGGYLAGVAYGNGVYVAVGQNGVAFSSTNATQWTARTSGTFSTIYDVAFGNNVFVATIAGSTSVLISSNGTNWTLQPTGLAGTYDSVVFRDGLFHAAGTRIATSPNGVTWTDRGAPSSLLIGVEKVPGHYVAYGTSGTLLVSSNFVDWTTIPIGTLQELKSAAFGNDSFVVVGRGGIVLQSDHVTNTPLSIVTAPAATSALAGGTATFSVGVSGRAPFSYQWFKNGKLIPGATGSTLNLSHVTTGDAGNYHVVVNTDTASQTSAPAALTVVSVNVGVHPEMLYLFTGTTGYFTAAVSGATPTGYQWQRYANVIPGATNSTLGFANAQLDNGGKYSVLVTFSLGQLDSTNSGYLTVLEDLDQVILYAEPSYLQLPIGSTISITSSIAGPVPSAIQWRRDGTNITGATGAVLTIPNAQPAHAGGYGYYVTYPLGSVTNETIATIEVYYAEPPLITSFQQTAPDNLRLEFTGLTNRYYQLQYAPNLAPPVIWEYYTADLLTTNPAVFDINIPLFGTEPRGFFRVKILPP